MLKTLIIVALITVTVPFTYMANKIASLTSLVGALDAKNTLLNKKHKKLKTKNKQLVTQREKTRKLVKSHRRKVTKRGIKRASKKMTKAGASMVPFAGVAVIAAATADDIDDLCNDIQEARDLEHDLLGETENAPNEESLYCHEAMAEELSRMADEARESIAGDFKISYKAMAKQADNITDSIKEYGEDYGRVSREYYTNTVEYWSEQ
jgi:hypothetical protein